MTDLYVSAAPLRSMLAKAAERRRPFNLSERRRVAGGIEQLAREYATRFGGREDSAARYIHRLLANDGVVSINVADRICTFLGEHLSLVYPDLEAATG